MENYSSISHLFPNPPDNKGLEGITVNTRNNHIFVVKEGRPGVLIEVSKDQSTILQSRLLSAENGFAHPSVGPKSLIFQASATTLSATPSGSPAIRASVCSTTTGRRTGFCNVLI